MSQRLKVKSIFGPTLQGEGYHTGTPCVFIRLSGCNAWDGREETKAESLCPYCDTDFTGGEMHTTSFIVGEVMRIAGGSRHVVISGGEPTIHPSDAMQELVRKLNDEGFYIQVETNGIRDAAWLDMVDWVTCSPKAAADLCGISPCVVSEIKILFPHPNKYIKVEDWIKKIPNAVFYVQPVWPEAKPAIDKVMSLAEYGVRLSLQTHKILGVE
jgi:organic radical activating enzyme